MSIIPYIIEPTPRGDRNSDLFSRMLMDRVIFLEGPIDSVSATSIVAQLMYLDSQNNENDIHMFIQSGGGSVDAGMSILDCIDLIKAPVKTIATGSVASMASVVLSHGKKGLRCATRRASIMCHQPRTHFMSGVATDIEIHTKQLMRAKQVLTQILANNCNQDYEAMLQTMERDYFMNSDEALKLGIIDTIL